MAADCLRSDSRNSPQTKTWAASVANGWSLGGNSGTAPGANFVGTTDNQPLEVKVNGLRALRIEPHGSSAPSSVGGYFQNTGNNSVGTVIAGGGTNGAISEALGDYAFIGAGVGTKAGAFSIGSRSMAAAARARGAFTP